MPDPYRKVSPGQSFEFAAASYNAIIEQARSGKLDPRVPHVVHRGGAAGSGAAAGPGGGLVRVRNETQTLIPRFSVVRLGDCVIAPSVNESEYVAGPVFGADVVELLGDPVAVLQEPLRPGQIGAAVVSGVTIAIVDASPFRRQIMAHPGGTKFSTVGDGGYGSLLYVEAEGGGDQLAVVCLSGSADVWWPATLRENQPGVGGGNSGNTIFYYNWASDAHPNHTYTDDARSLGQCPLIPYGTAVRMWRSGANVDGSTTGYRFDYTGGVFPTHVVENGGGSDGSASTKPSYRYDVYQWLGEDADYSGAAPVVFDQTVGDDLRSNGSFEPAQRALCCMSGTDVVFAWIGEQPRTITCEEAASA